MGLKRTDEFRQDAVRIALTNQRRISRMDENDEGSHGPYFLLAEMAFGTGISASTAQAID